MTPKTIFVSKVPLALHSRRLWVRVPVETYSVCDITCFPRCLPEFPPGAASFPTQQQKLSPVSALAPASRLYTTNKPLPQPKK